MFTNEFPLVKKIKQSALLRGEGAFFDDIVYDFLLFGLLVLNKAAMKYWGTWSLTKKESLPTTKKESVKKRKEPPPSPKKQSAENKCCSPLSIFYNFYKAMVNEESRCPLLQTGRLNGWDG